MNRAETLRRYGALFAALTPERLPELGELVGDQVRFRDPFNDVQGRDAFLGVFREMFDTLVEPTFAVEDSALGARAGYLRWTMTFRTRRGGAAWRITGMSELQFDDDGRVVLHLDHWDAGSQFYARLPLLGWLIERVRRRVAH